MITAISSDRVFTGDATLADHAVVVEGEAIRDVVPRASIPADARHVELADRWLAPGFIDAQVNGGAGLLFNDDPSAATVRAMVAAHARHGTTTMLPTLITDTADKIAAAAAVGAAAVAAGEPGVAGIHFEGPYLSPRRRGAHDEQLFRTPTAAELAHFAPPPGGVSLVTLAPEVVPAGTIAELAGQGVVVCAGHTEATCEQIVAARGEGLRGYTHLFNAMSPLTSRAPGTVGAALTDPDGWCGIIADGHHVRPETLRIAIAAKPAGKVFLVTDSMSTVGTDLTEFVLTGQQVTNRDGRLTLADGTLAGSVLDMAGAVRNAVHLLGQSVPEALAMAGAYPAAFLRLDDTRGYLRPGYRADLVALDDELACHATWIAGTAVYGT